jgi:hypothetical protein
MKLNLGIAAVAAIIGKRNGGMPLTPAELDFAARIAVAEVIRANRFAEMRKLELREFRRFDREG